MKTAYRLRFRAWDHHLGQFVYFSARDSFGRVPADIPDSHIHQCACVMDASGRDVYEGDVVRMFSGAPASPSHELLIVSGPSGLPPSTPMLTTNRMRIAQWQDLVGKFIVSGNIFQGAEFMEENSADQ